MALKFYGQFSTSDEEQKKPSQVASEQNKATSSGLKYYGQFAESGQQQASRLSQFKASEPTPTKTTAPTVAPAQKEQSLWEKIGSTVASAVKSVMDTVNPQKSNAPTIAPISPTIPTTPTQKPLNTAGGLSLDLGGSPSVSQSASLSGLGVTKADSILKYIEPIVKKNYVDEAIKAIQTEMSKPSTEQSVFWQNKTRELAIYQQATDAVKQAIPLFKGFEKGAAGTYMNSIPSFENYSKEKLTVPTDWFGKAQYTVGEFAGNVVGLMAGGSAVKALKFGRLGLPILFGVTGQTSAGSETTIRQRIAKAPVDMLTGYLFSKVPQSDKILSKATAIGAGVTAAVTAPTTFISYLIQGLPPEDAAKYAMKASLINSVFHVGMVGINQATTAKSAVNEGVVMTPAEAKAQVQSTDMPVELKKELQKAIIDAEAQGKDIQASGYAKKPAPISKVIGKEVTQALTGQEQKSEVGIKFDLVEKKQIQLLSDEGATSAQPPVTGEPKQIIQPTATVVVPQKPAVSVNVESTLQKAISTYISDEGVYKKPDGTIEPTPALKELTVIAETPEGQKIAQEKVQTAIDSGEIKPNEDGTITVYRVGSMRNDNRLTSVSFDKQAATDFQQQASVTGTERPIVEMKIQPSDVKVFIGGTEKEILIKQQTEKPVAPTSETKPSEPTPQADYPMVTDTTKSLISNRVKGVSAEKVDAFLHHADYAKSLTTDGDVINAIEKNPELAKMFPKEIAAWKNIYEKQSEKRFIFNKYFDKTNENSNIIEARMVLASQVESGKITYEQMAKEVGIKYTTIPSPTTTTTTHSASDKPTGEKKVAGEGTTKPVGNNAVKSQEATDIVIDAIRSGDLEAAQALYTDLSVDGDVQMVPFQEIVSLLGSEDESITKEVEQIKMDLKSESRQGDEPTAALLRIADRLGKYFTAPRTLFIITGKDRTYQLPNGDKITVGGDTTEALDRLIFTSDLNGFGQSIHVLARKFDKVFSEIDASIQKGNVDGGDYEQFKTAFSEYIAKRPNYTAGRSGIVKDVPKQVATTDSKTVSVEPLTPVTENVAPETVDDRVQRILDEKQKNKDIKDVGDRVGGSKKEMSAFKRITIADLSGIDDATAYDITTKDRVLGEFDPQLYKDAGFSSGIVYLKDRLHSLLRSKPENNTKAREMYLTKMPDVMKRIDEAKTFADITTIAKYLDGGSNKFSSWFSKKESQKMSDDEMVFGKTFINLMQNRTEATRQTWHDATKFNAITEDTLKQVYDKDMLQSAKRKEYKLKQLETPEAEYLNFMRLISPKEYKQVMSEKRSNPEAFKKRLDTYVQQTKESIDRMYSPVSYEDYLKRTKYEVKPDDWSWMTKESPKQKQASGDMEIHTVEPLSEIVRKNGRVVTDSELDPQVLKDQYGYDSVQFGNSISDKESKAHIKYYLASMKDLEDILHLDVAQINREAKLSIAFAARGSGKALAHYEGMRKIINITKTRGGGAAGHEWFHYLDHVIGGARPNLEKSMGFASGGYRAQTSEWFNGDSPETPYAVRQALKGVMDAMRVGDNGHTMNITVSNDKGSVRYPSIKQKFDEGGHERAISFIQQYNSDEPEKNLKYYQDLARIEGKDIQAPFKYKESQYMTEARRFKSDYWSRPTEMFARAGQAYIQDKMAEQGIENNYITHNVDATQSKSTDLWSQSGLQRAYPQGVERQIINKLFDKLFDTLREKYPYHQSSEQRVNETIELASEQEVNTAKEEAQTTATPKTPTGSGYADVGGYREDASSYFTGKMTGVEFPELLKIAVELTGDVPSLKKFVNKLGVFYAEGKGEIKLNYEIFKNPSTAAKTFAHEIGHLVDYLPDHYMNRGNILGRIATLNSYLKRFLKESPSLPDEPLTEKVKEELRKQAKAMSKSGMSEIQPQDILDIWNTVEAKNKDLESYIAKLDTTQKKEILKSELKGVVPEWVDANFKAPDQKWQSIYEKLLKEEIIKRKLMDENIIKQELKDLSQYWKPFDETVNPSFTKYRYSSVELYADAISVLLNDPELLEQKAPTFYKGFFNWLDNKPVAKKAFFDSWDLINRGDEAVFRDRQKAITDSEMQAEEKWKLKEQEKRNLKKNLPYILQTLFQDKDAVIIGKVEELIKQGKDIPPEMNPRYALHSLTYLDGEIRAWIDTKVMPVFNKANEVQDGWSLLNQILQFERALYERGDMANPHGHNPKTAADSLRTLESLTDPKDWQNLTETKDLFRTMVKDFIDFAEKHGYYSKDLITQMRANPAYATYQVVDYLDENVSPRVYKSKGTLKGVANTATSTVMKLISTYKAIARNDAKISIIDTLSKYSPEDIETAKTVFVSAKKPKQFIDPKDRNLELVIGVKDGEMVGYYMPKEIAQSLNYHENGTVRAVASIAKMVSATPIYRPIFTTINFGFQLGNFYADFMRNWENFPDRNLLEAMQSFAGLSAEYAKALPVSIRKAKNVEDPIITDMRERRMLGVGFMGVFNDEELKNSQKIERVLGTYGAVDVEETNKLKIAYNKVMDTVSFMGEVIESLPKIAAYERTLNRTDLSEQEKAEYIRTQAGSPDFRMGGLATPITNNIFMFSNAQIQANVADFRMVTDKNYKPYRAAYFFKFILGAIIPTLIAIAIKQGLMGEQKKKELENVSEYDKANYNIVTFGFDENGKTIYTRARKSERDRLIGGLLWKMANMFGAEKMGVADVMDVLSYAGGQVPSLSPNFSLIGGIMQYVSGLNPYDDFRGRLVIPDTAFKAGPKYSLPYMLNWVLDTSGARILIPKVPVDNGRTTPLEKTLSLPILSNIIGKWLKVSDYGQVEKLQDIRTQVQSEAAIKTLDRKAAINDAIKEYKKSGNRAEIERKLVDQVVGKIDSSAAKTSRTTLLKQFREGVLKGEADPLTNSIIIAASNAEKIQVLKDAKAKLSSGDFYKKISSYYQDGLISKDVIREVRK